MADPSRRALVVGLAALPGCCAPFVTVATASVMPQDPIFAAPSHNVPSTLTP